MEKIAALEVHIQVLDRASESESNIVLVVEIQWALGRDSEPLTFNSIIISQWGEWLMIQQHKQKAYLLRFTFRSTIRLHFMCQTSLLFLLKCLILICY